MGSNKAMGSSRVMESNKAMGRTRGMDRNLAMDNKGTDRNLVMDSSKATGSNLAMTSSKATGRNQIMVSLKATDSPMATSIRTSINTSILRAAPRPAAATSTRRHRRPRTLQATLARETSIRWAATWKYNPAVHSFHHSIRGRLQSDGRLYGSITLLCIHFIIPSKKNYRDVLRSQRQGILAKPIISGGGFIHSHKFYAIK